MRSSHPLLSRGYGLVSERKALVSRTNKSKPSAFGRKDEISESESDAESDDSDCDSESHESSDSELSDTDSSESDADTSSSDDVNSWASKRGNKNQRQSNINKNDEDIKKKQIDLNSKIDDNVTVAADSKTPLDHAESFKVYQPNNRTESYILDCQSKSLSSKQPIIPSFYRQSNSQHALTDDNDQITIKIEQAAANLKAQSLRGFSKGPTNTSIVDSIKYQPVSKKSVCVKTRDSESDSNNEDKIGTGSESESESEFDDKPLMAYLRKLRVAIRDTGYGRKTDIKMDNDTSKLRWDDGFDSEPDVKKCRPNRLRDAEFQLKMICGKVSVFESIWYFRQREQRLKQRETAAKLKRLSQQRNRAKRMCLRYHAISSKWNKKFNLDVRRTVFRLKSQLAIDIKEDKIKNEINSLVELTKHSVEFVNNTASASSSSSVEQVLVPVKIEQQWSSTQIQIDQQPRNRIDSAQSECETVVKSEKSRAYESFVTVKDETGAEQVRLQLRPSETPKIKQENNSSTIIKQDSDSTSVKAENQSANASGGTESKNNDTSSNNFEIFIKEEFPKFVQNDMPGVIKQEKVDPINKWNRDANSLNSIGVEAESSNNVQLDSKSNIASFDSRHMSDGVSESKPTKISFMPILANPSMKTLIKPGALERVGEKLCAQICRFRPGVVPYKIHVQSRYQDDLNGWYILKFDDASINMGQVYPVYAKKTIINGKHTGKVMQIGFKWAGGDDIINDLRWIISEWYMGTFTA